MVYLAAVPRSNALYTAYMGAMQWAKQTESLVPLKIILNAPTKLMKQQEYGAGYRHDHDQPDALTGQYCFLDSMERGNTKNPSNLASSAR